MITDEEAERLKTEVMALRELQNSRGWAMLRKVLETRREERYEGMTNVNLTDEQRGKHLHAFLDAEEIVSAPGTVGTDWIARELKWRTDKITVYHGQK